MKLRNWVLSAVAAAVFLAGPAYALEGFYVGAGAVNWTYNEPATTPEDLSGTGINVKFGQNFIENLGWEVEMGGGGSDSVVVNVPGVGQVPVDLALDFYTSFFLRAILPLPRLHLYGAVGFTSAMLTADAGLPVTGTESGVSFGAGAELEVVNGWFVGGEFMRYLDTDAIELTAKNIFLKKYFW